MTPERLAEMVTTGRRLHDAWRGTTPSISASSMRAATEWQDWLTANIEPLLDGTIAVLDAAERRAEAAEADADRLAQAITSHGPFVDNICRDALAAHAAAMALRLSEATS